MQPGNQFIRIEKTCTMVYRKWQVNTEEHYLFSLRVVHAAKVSKVAKYGLLNGLKIDTGAVSTIYFNLLRMASPIFFIRCRLNSRASTNLKGKDP